jgi:hypothetical protein
MPTVLAARERLLDDLDVLLVEDVDGFMSPLASRARLRGLVFCDKYGVFVGVDG